MYEGLVWELGKGWEPGSGPSCWHGCNTKAGMLLPKHSQSAGSKVVWFCSGESRASMVEVALLQVFIKELDIEVEEVLHDVAKVL